MYRVMIAVFVLGFAACAQSDGGTTPPTQEVEAGGETPATDTVAEVEAEPACGRNSSEICDCAEGGSGLRVCLEGVWADCACDDDGFDNDDLAFDDE